MEKVNFHNKEQKDLFDDNVFNNPYSFIQQSTRWAEIVSAMADDEPFFLYHKTKDYKITSSLYLFRSEFGNILVSNVQAGSLGCVTFSGKESHREQAYKRILDENIRFAEENNCVTMTITSNPFNRDSELIKQIINPDTGMESFISIIEIDNFFRKDGNVKFRDYNRRSNLSRNIKKACKQNFQFRSIKNKEVFNEWYKKIHSKRINELGGTPISYELLKNVLFDSGLAPFSSFFSIYKDDKLIGGDICIFNKNGILDNFMMSTLREYQELGANFFLVDNILHWCFDNGMKIYNWQSSNPPKGGIFNFKQQWGSFIKPYFYFTKILDQKKFDRILKNNSLQNIKNVFQGHFFAPFHTVKKSVYDVKTKAEIQEIVNHKRV